MIKALEILSEKNPLLYMFLISLKKDIKPKIFKRYLKVKDTQKDILYVYGLNNISYKNFKEFLKNEDKRLIFISDKIEEFYFFFKDDSSLKFLKKENVFYHF